MPVVSLNMLVAAMLSREPYNQMRFGREAERYARSIIGKVARDLPEDLQSEVVQEALALLIATDPTKLKTKSGTALLRSAVFSGIRTIRANYAPPGVRTRRVDKQIKPDRVAAEQVDQIARPADVARAIVVEDDRVEIDFDRFQSPAAAAAIHQMECEIDAVWALRRAPPNVASALRLIHFGDVGVEMASEIVGISRFAFNRRVKTLTALLAA